jgi:hypothetical protein
MLRWLLHAGPCINPQLHATDVAAQIALEALEPRGEQTSG